MRLKVPLTGTVGDYDILAAQHDGIGVVGSLLDPVKPVELNLRHVSWRLVTIDLVNDLAEIEVSPAENINVLKEGGRTDNQADWTRRAATELEKQGFLAVAKSLVESHTKDELYTMSKAKRLVKPTEAVEKYKKNPPNVAAREALLAGNV
ncbi:MAG: hypothetical protein Q8P31_13415 [Bacillota bacterium]|nr:hypothetical protein [Bacillota bacterium]